MKVKSENEVLQSCLTLCDPIDCSLPVSSIHGIFQAKVLEWGAIAFSNNKYRIIIFSPLFCHNWLLKSFNFFLFEYIETESILEFRVLEKAMAPHSSTLAWKIPWMEEPGRLHAVHGVTKNRTQLSDFTFTFHFHALEKEMATHSSVLAWRSPGTGEPGGLPSMPSMGSHRVGHD